MRRRNERSADSLVRQSEAAADSRADKAVRDPFGLQLRHAGFWFFKLFQDAKKVAAERGHPNVAPAFGVRGLQPRFGIARTRKRR